MAKEPQHQKRVSILAAIAIAFTFLLYLVANQPISNIQLPYDLNPDNWIWVVIAIFIFDLAIFISELTLKGRLKDKQAD